MSFKKFQNSAQNPKLLAFGFTEKHQFAAKPDRNIIFLGREAYNPDQLYILVLYIDFY
jgi:hypothetical protein